MGIGLRFLAKQLRLMPSAANACWAVRHSDLIIWLCPEVSR